MESSTRNPPIEPFAGEGLSIYGSRALFHPRLPTLNLPKRAGSIGVRGGKRETEKEGGGMAGEGGWQ